MLKGRPVIKDVVDLSVPLKSMDTIVAPCFPQPLRTTFTNFKEDGFKSYAWTLVEHVGTHVDAPGHTFEEGVSIDQISLSRYIGPGLILDFRDRPPRYAIRRDDVLYALDRAKNKDEVGAGWVILFLTGYSSKARLPEWLQHPGLSEDAVRLIADMKVNAIGIDAPSPDIELEVQEFEPAHKIFPLHSVAIYENLINLDRLLETDFLFVGCPLPLIGGTGSPVRAMALIIE